MPRWIELVDVQAYSFGICHRSDMVTWMQRYDEFITCDMDLADASLYQLMAETDIVGIMTVDRNDFERDRLPQGSCFGLASTV